MQNLAQVLALCEEYINILVYLDQSQSKLIRDEDEIPKRIANWCITLKGDQEVVLK